MANLTPALPQLAKKGIKLAVNAGASDTEKLAKVVVKAVSDAGLDLKVRKRDDNGRRVIATDKLCR